MCKNLFDSCFDPIIISNVAKSNDSEIICINIRRDLESISLESPRYDSII